MEFSLNPERVGPLLRRLVSPTRTRARIYDRDGELLLDLRSLSGRSNILRFDLPPGVASRAQISGDAQTPFEEFVSMLRRWSRPGLPLYEDIGAGNGKAYPEVGDALAGNARWVVRANAKGETIISVAVPVQRFRSVRGALLLSTLGGDIDVVIATERWAIIRIFLVSAGVMLLLSLLFAGAIAEPMRRLAEAAERVRRGVKSRQEIPDFTDRQDEIGHLSGALRDMTKALYNRIEAIEHFAADVAHELKNRLPRCAAPSNPADRQDRGLARAIAGDHQARRGPAGPADQRYFRRVATRRRTGARRHGDRQSGLGARDRREHVARRRHRRPCYGRTDETKGRKRGGARRLAGARP